MTKKFHKIKTYEKDIAIINFSYLYIYTIMSLFVEIPRVFNNIFYAIVTVFAVYFGIFYSEIGKE
ncbi:hypothetical protein D1631_18645 [Chryseobacterium nematophagum]|uniref:Uncharacterized protein n=1 Tax=Chryseobacterium nematophagum TaxID=2305228 RepID=A0A3M7TBK1_9FLAO|nr:hypothetical protein D1631_18645 [Chryseobacterium nematophagum]